MIPNGVKAGNSNSCRCSKSYDFSNRQLRMLSVSRLSDEKNIALIIFEVRKILDFGLDIRYDIVGEGPQRFMLEELVMGLGLNQHVFFHGYAYNIVEFYQDSDIFVSASKTEGHPISVLEAMSYGRLLCILSDIPGHQFEKNGVCLYFNKDTSPLVNKIIDIFYAKYSDEAVSKIISSAQDMVKKYYSIDCMMRRYLKTYLS